MTANRLELVGLSVFVVVASATVSPAQNTSNSLLSGNYHQSGAQRQFDGPAGAV
jgi:hypothetical protein